MGHGTCTEGGQRSNSEDMRHVQRRDSGYMGQRRDSGYMGQVTRRESEDMGHEEEEK